MIDIYRGTKPLGVKMFASLVSTVVLAGAIAMPIAGNGNDYLGPKHDWAPLYEAYNSCAYSETNTLTRYICAQKHYVAATTNLKKA
jgi:hypothetical protein